MNIQELIKNKDILKIKSLIGSGEIIVLKDKLISSSEYKTYLKNQKLSEYYDMLQGVKKVLLKLRLLTGMLIENLVNSVKTQQWKILSQAA